MEQSISLLELNRNIQELINKSLPDSLWIVAEISELKINRNGHCYLELIEKDIISENIIARCRATIWAFTFRLIKPYFESITSQELSPGLKILFRAKVEYHELYGLSLNITDIEPSYTLGDLAKKRAETLKMLEAEGVINMNKEVDLPIVIQRIAIISSETAAGYQDFINQLKNNNKNYIFYTKLFPSIMQGTQAETSIIQSLETIYNYEDLFDIVVIIRGGGSQADLNCFNSYNLASHVAQFPIPVITGIGHDKDESVVDIVANTKLKTPTAVAEFIILKTSEFEIHLNELGNSAHDLLSDFIFEQNNNLNQLISFLSPVTKHLLLKEKHILNLLKSEIKVSTSISIKNRNSEIENLKYKTIISSTGKITTQKDLLNQINKKKLQYTKTFLQSTKYKLSLLVNNLRLLSPDNILKRGYTITSYEGKTIKDPGILKPDDLIITTFYNGRIKSKVR
ncbi:MAG: exodeoxyribonuclease VII large subunit [Bacteroidales bacterium]